MDQRCRTIRRRRTGAAITRAFTFERYYIRVPSNTWVVPAADRWSLRGPGCSACRGKRSTASSNGRFAGGCFGEAATGRHCRSVWEKTRPPTASATSTSPWSSTRTRAPHRPGRRGTGYGSRGSAPPPTHQRCTAPAPGSTPPSPEGSGSRGPGRVAEAEPQLNVPCFLSGQPQGLLGRPDPPSRCFESSLLGLVHGPTSCPASTLAWDDMGGVRISPWSQARGLSPIPTVRFYVSLDKGLARRMQAPTDSTTAPTRRQTVATAASWVPPALVVGCPRQPAGETPALPAGFHRRVARDRGDGVRPTARGPASFFVGCLRHGREGMRKISWPRSLEWCYSLRAPAWLKTTAGLWGSASRV